MNSLTHFSPISHFYTPQIELMLKLIKRNKHFLNSGVGQDESRSECESSESDEEEDNMIIPVTSVLKKLKIVSVVFFVV